MFSVTCGNCGASLNAPDTVAGKKVKCKKCGTTFVARKPAAAPPPPLPKTEPPPRKRRPDPRDADESDDRPQRSRPVEQEGSKGRMLIIGGLVGVLVLFGLCGFSVGGYFAFVYEPSPKAVAEGRIDLVPTPADPAPPPKKLAPEPLVDDPITAGWQDVRDAEGAYRIKFPAMPVRRQMPIPSPSGMSPAPTYAVMGMAESFISGVVRLPKSKAKLTDDQILDRMVEHERNAAMMMGGPPMGGPMPGPPMQGPGGPLGQKPQPPAAKSISFAGRKGREVTMTFPGRAGGAVTRFILVDDRVILVRAVGESVTPDSPRVKAFLNSLRLD